MSWKVHPILTILCIAIIAYFGFKMRVWFDELCRSYPIVRWLSIIVICSACLIYLILPMIWQ
jgi:hypothetical protein